MSESAHALCRELDTQGDRAYRDKALSLDALRSAAAHFVRQSVISMAALCLLQMIGLRRNKDVRTLMFKEIKIKHSASDSVTPDPMPMLVLGCYNYKAVASRTRFDSITTAHTDLGLCPLFHTALYMAGNPSVSKALADIRSHAMHEFPKSDYLTGQNTKESAPRWGQYRLFSAGPTKAKAMPAFSEITREGVHSHFKKAFQTLGEVLSGCLHALRHGGLQVAKLVQLTEAQQKAVAQWHADGDGAKERNYDPSSVDPDAVLLMCGHRVKEGRACDNHHLLLDWAAVKTAIPAVYQQQAEQLEAGCLLGWRRQRQQCPSAGFLGQPTLCATPCAEMRIPS